MFGEGYTISYLNYVIFLWIICGALILICEIKPLKELGYLKEIKITKYLGWINIGIGVALFITKNLVQ
ncbi:CLC_0170 family protein [Paenibacillus sp. HB172176]|uniref:CLC_0170 family protein n=1 Tax=Paenibacillus sp. HB172176 TaxID=2493690 RepID=UPI00143A57DF|nr:CLC_0170 family protein [Paenibacillus sp. HB172176]